MSRAVVVLVAIGLAASLGAFVLAQADRTREFCMAIPGGLSGSEVEAHARDAGYRTERLTASTARISSVRSLHTYACRVDFVDDSVRAVTYVGGSRGVESGVAR